MFLIFAIITTVICATVHCYSLVPQRANITFSNDKWVLNSRLWVTRLSRKSPYFFNVETNLRHTWGNNVTAHAVFYEFLNNEYRRTFMEIHTPFCGIWNYPLDIGVMLSQKGVPCPMPPGFYGLYNMTIPMSNFHYRMPFAKFKAEMETISDTNQSIAKGYLYATFVPDKKNVKN